MGRTALTAATAFVVGGLTIGAVLSYAQPAPPTPSAPMGAPMEGAMDGHGPMADGHPWMRWMRNRTGIGPDAGAAHRLRAFALVYRREDRALTPPDVQKIAEAFLLWNGNHTWKVVDTATTSDGQIGFSLATADGSVIAKFTMDPHTAKLTRID